MPGKKTVSVKKFLADFRSGASDEDLMARHGLDKRGLRKMLTVLEERQLVPAEELKRSSQESVDDQQGFNGFALPLPLDERPLSSHRPDGENQEDPHSACPQCGAHVTDKMLTCPECGHVLPGETRWSRVQPERSSRYRIPPWLIGCIIAFPIALGMYAVFKHILIPMSAASIHKRTHPVGTAVHDAHPQGSTTGNRRRLRPSLEEVMKRRTAEGILLSASDDYSFFKVSDRWYSMSREEKLAFVSRLGSDLEASGIVTSFEIRDESGIVGARMNKQAIELLDRYGFSETIPKQETDDSQPQSGGTDIPASPQATTPPEARPRPGTDR